MPLISVTTKVETGIFEEVGIMINDLNDSYKITIENVVSSLRWPPLSLFRWPGQVIL